MTFEMQQQDLDLWRQWKTTNDPKALHDLMEGLNPLIQKEVNKWGSTVPQQALEAKAKMLTLEALKSYNPQAGAAVGTHVASRIRKLSRSVYPYQNVARLPENKQLLYNAFSVSKNKLIDELGRDPNSDELADELGWSNKKVTKFQQAFGRRELVESSGSDVMDGNEDDSLVDFYHHGLSPEDKVLFEHVTGFHGSPVLSNAQLVKKFKMTQGQLSYKKRRFVDQITQIQSGKQR